MSHDTTSDKEASMKQHYIEFIYPGSFLSESTDSPVEVRLFDGTWPERAHGYRFFSREEIWSNGETLKGCKKDFSGITYRGKVMTLEDVPDTDEYYVLRNNMRCNGYDRVVRTHFGQAFPLKADDVVVA